MKFRGESIAVDIDSTLLIGHYNYPEPGEPNILLINSLNKFRELGGIVVLWTLREGELLDPALKVLSEAGLKWDYVNENIPERMEKWGGDPRKIAVSYYMDDKNIGMLEFMKMVDFEGDDN